MVRVAAVAAVQAQAEALSRHLLPNTLIPVVTLMGVQFAGTAILRSEGRNPFFEYQLPRTVISRAVLG